MRISDWSSDVCSSDLRGMYPRRMFDIFQLDQTDRVPQEYRDPCPACLDFSRSWTCTDPHDQKQHGWPRVAVVELARSEERRCGKACVSTCRSRGSPSTLKNKQINKQNSLKI